MSDSSVGNEWYQNRSNLKVLALAPKISGAISLLSSTLIILSFIRDHRKLGKPYHRLVLGMSISDWITSFDMFLSTWMLPRGFRDFSFHGATETIEIPWAIGNMETCQIQAMLLQLAHTTLLYGLSLGLYFMLVVRFRWSDRRIGKIEPLLHLVPIIWGVGAALGGKLSGIYGVTFPICWVVRPSQETNTRSVGGLIFRWVGVFLPAWLSIVALSGVCLTIYLHVRLTQRKSRRFRFSVAVEERQEFNAGLEGEEPACDDEKTSEETGMPATTDDTGRTENTPTWLSRRLSLDISRRFSVGRSSLRRRPWRQPSRLEQNRNLQKEVSSQCFLFAGSFFIVWFPATVRLLRRQRGKYDMLNHVYGYR